MQHGDDALAGFDAPRRPACLPHRDEQNTRFVLLGVAGVVLFCVARAVVPGLAALFSLSFFCAC